MGTIAARDALRVLELTEQVAAAHLIACSQALRLRQRQEEITASMLPASLTALMEHAPFIDEDTPLDKQLAALTASIAKREWRLNWPDDPEPAE
jgi:histidine ammonia-lyase